MERSVPLELDVSAAHELIEGGALLLDVRDAEEREEQRIAGSVWIPMDELARRWSELPGEGTLVIHCAAGVRSLRAAKFLRDKGRGATSMVGGLAEWAARGLPVESGPERAPGPSR